VLGSLPVALEESSFHLDLFLLFFSVLFLFILAFTHPLEPLLMLVENLQLC